MAVYNGSSSSNVDASSDCSSIVHGSQEQFLGISYVGIRLRYIILFGRGVHILWLRSNDVCTVRDSLHPSPNRIHDSSRGTNGCQYCGPAEASAIEPDSLTAELPAGSWPNDDRPKLIKEIPAGLQCNGTIFRLQGFLTNLERVLELIMIPLIINGQDYVAESKARIEMIDGLESFQGADEKACDLALQSCGTAYQTWSQTKPRARRQLLLNLGDVCVTSVD